MYINCKLQLTLEDLKYRTPFVWTTSMVLLSFFGPFWSFTACGFCFLKQVYKPTPKTNDYAFIFY